MRVLKAHLLSQLLLCVLVGLLISYFINKGKIFYYFYYL